MNIIKNILLVSYLKNKGVRRICFVVSCIMLIWFAYMSIFNARIYDRIDIKYNNFQELNLYVYNAWNYKYKNWSKVIGCASSFMEKQGFLRSDAWSMTVERDITIKESKWCYAYEKACSKLNQISQNPIHLKCGFFETFETTNTEGAVIWFSTLILFIYFPFLTCLLVKLAYKMVKNITIWIYKGFKGE